MNVELMFSVLYFAFAASLATVVFLHYLWEGHLPLMPKRNKCRRCGNVDVGGWGRCPECNSIHTEPWDGPLKRLASANGGE